jgi:hypothetical protein
MEYLGTWGTLIHEKNLKSKILCQTPFKKKKKQKSKDIIVFQLLLFWAKALDM